jgi:alpha-galactosidase/6-phospho-beta-glucosidase family protein
VPKVTIVGAGSAVFARQPMTDILQLTLDPLTAAICSPTEISDLFDEMWAAERGYLRPFEAGSPLPTEIRA